MEDSQIPFRSLHKCDGFDNIAFATISSALLCGTTPLRFCCPVVSETPQYLRKILFPMHPDLKFAGLQNPLDAPHHLRKGEKILYREGVVLEHRHEPKDRQRPRPDEGCYVCCGTCLESFCSRRCCVLFSETFGLLFSETNPARFAFGEISVDVEIATGTPPCCWRESLVKNADPRRKMM